MDVKIKDNTVVKEVVDSKLLESFSNYNKFLGMMAADVPIQVLSLSKEVESILLREGYDRVYMLLNADLTKIKGIGKLRGYRLAASLDKFLSM